MSRRIPVLMIALDAAELSLVRRWMEEGALPNLRALKERGAFGPLASTAGWLVGSPWPSFYTGLPPSEHGLYHYLVWRPDLMRHERPAPQWLPLRPFWRELAADRRVVAVDIPLTYAPQPFAGIEISGWATHETLEPPASHPPQLLSWVRENFGAAPFDNEEAYLMPASRLLQIRDRCVRATAQVAGLGVTLMREKPWDLFMICLAATHRGGHQLWDLSNVAGDTTAEQRTALAGALKEIYVACDAAVGRMVEQAGSEASVLVFSLHGMGANVSRAELTREMLARVLADGERHDPRLHRRLAGHLRSWIPDRLRSWIKSRLPLSVQDRLTLFWRSEGGDWRATRAFAALSDLDGYVRINLRGREAAGVVEPGAEYDALCTQITRGLSTFVDAQSGEPVIDAIARIGELYPRGRMRQHLPDLMIRWSDKPAALHKGIVSPRYGSIPWPTPGGHPQGRSGNHLPQGFLFAAGPRVARGTSVIGAHILDLAPTVYELLDLAPPAQLHGRSLVRALEGSRGVP